MYVCCNSSENDFIIFCGIPVFIVINIAERLFSLSNGNCTQKDGDVTRVVVSNCLNNIVDWENQIFCNSRSSSINPFNLSHR